MELILKKEIHSSLSSVSDLVVLVVKKLNKLLINSSIINDIEISIAEAMTNIVKHAYNYDENQIIEFFLYKSNNNIIINLLDSAPKAKIDFNKKLDYNPDDVDSLPEGGMGLFLINKCMTSVSLKRVNNKNELTMMKSL